MKLIRYLLACVLVSPLGAARAEELDWDTWERLPLLEGGRRMPLDTFARSLTEEICGRENPKLWLPEEAKQDSADYKIAAEMFPDGRPRRFRASELIFSWLVEPERWQAVPFLAADNRLLREEVFDLPVGDEFGRLRFVSPLATFNSRKLPQRLRELDVARRSEGPKWEPVGLDRALQKLVIAYRQFEGFTTDPRKLDHTTDRFNARRNAMVEAVENMAKTLRQEGRMTDSDETAKRLTAAAGAMEPLLKPAAPQSFSWQATEDAVITVRRRLGDLAQYCQQQVDENKGSTRMAILATDAAREAHEAHLALYDAAPTLRLAPALNPQSLEPDREPDDDAQPWLGFGALMHGSDALLEGYPMDEVRAVRQAWADVCQAYLDRQSAGRPARFAAAMNQFSGQLRQLGEAVTPLREKLPLRKKDEGLLSVTAYPPAGYTDTEVVYNRFSPFFWSWIVGLGSVFCLSLSFGVVRRPMFWAGVAVLVVAQAITIAGFAMRMQITGLVPLTNMFETVVFVGLCVPLMGLWFTMLPLTWPGLSAAWQATSLPRCWRGDQADGETLYLGSTWRTFSAAAILVRLALIVPVTWATTNYVSVKFNLTGGGILQSLGEVQVWLVAVCVAIGVVYYATRLAPALLLSLITVPRAVLRSDWSELRDRVIGRRAFALAGATVGVIAAVAAFFAPESVMSERIANTAPILRDNFWLFVHVLTISASYGAGALAWGLSNAALAIYLFGKYRRDEESGRILPPEQCNVLAQFSYKAIQVAVLLLAAGTLLGALWADKAWGRFWSWDSKETWSLLTLLAYMAILHARHIGWVGSFGMAFGAVLGATFIIIAWYGVNFLLPAGKHSYGAGGAGGQLILGSAVALNWVFLMAATVRYNLAIRDEGQGARGEG